MLKKALFTAALLASALGATAAQAQTAIRQLDADTLLVELRYGKPPHQRMLLEREKDPEVFAAFDEQRLQPKRNLFAGFFAGAPGKGNYPQTRANVDASAQETTEFAQFEESAEDDEGRVEFWHGAPGKGQPLR